MEQHVKQLLMKKLFTLLALGLPMLTFAQSITKHVITPAGGFDPNESGNLQIYWSLGEVATSRIAAEQLILTQGFHQLDLQVNPIFESENFDLSIDIYPNPAVGKLQLRQEQINRFQIKIQDLLGRVIISENWTMLEKEIDLSKLPNQTYLLTLQSDRAIKSFKIIKT